MKTKCVFEYLEDVLKSNEQFPKVMEGLKDRKIQVFFFL